MNRWTELSIALANQRDYLDQLFKVYPLIPEVIRDVDSNKWQKVEKAFTAKDNIALIESMLSLELFPVKDSYVAYFRRDKSSIARNPQTVNRLAGRMYEMGLDELWKRVSEPKETNRQIGPLFRRWAHSGVLGVPVLDKDEFLKTTQNAILDGADAALKNFAVEHLNYRNNKGIDLVAKFNGKYVIAEAKFLTDFGGHQDRQLEDAISLVETTGVDAICIAILDGVLYIPNKGSMHRTLLNNADHPILSSLLLRDYLFQI